MKKLILTGFTLIILLFVSCETKNRDLINDQDKERIKSDIQTVFEQMIQSSEAGNFEFRPFVNSPGFISIVNGKISDYKEFIKSNTAFFDLVDNQIFDEAIMFYTFIDKETVILTYGATVIANFKDGHQSKADPLAWTVVFRKMDESWKVIYSHESFKIVPIVEDSTKSE